MQSQIIHRLEDLRSDYILLREEGEGDMRTVISMLEKALTEIESYTNDEI